MATWSGEFANYAAQHPEVGEAAGQIMYVPNDWICAVQAGEHHLLVWTGRLPVTALSRSGETLPEPDLGTGQDLKSYLKDWDKPDDAVMRERGVSQLMVWSVKNALRRGGLVLQYPAPQGSDAGWKVYPAGFPVPPDWRG